MQPAPRTSGVAGRRRAWTLVEVLLATLLGSTVAAMTANIAVDTVRTRDVVRRELDRRWARFLVLQVFEQDVQARLRGLPVDVPVIEVPANPEATVAMLSLVHPPRTASVFPRKLPARIAYSIEPTGRDERKRFVREVRFLTDPPERVGRDVLTSDLREARIEFLIDGRWVEHALQGGEASSPRAVRLVCEWAGDERQRIRTVVLDEAEGGS